jgi:hypothetical protein
VQRIYVCVTTDERKVYFFYKGHARKMMDDGCLLLVDYTYNYDIRCAHSHRSPSNAIIVLALLSDGEMSAGLRLNSLVRRADSCHHHLLTSKFQFQYT